MAWKLGNLYYPMYQAKHLAEFFGCSLFEVFDLGEDGIEELWREFLKIK